MKTKTKIKKLLKNPKGAIYCDNVVVDFKRYKKNLSLRPYLVVYNRFGTYCSDWLSKEEVGKLIALPEQTWRIGEKVVVNSCIYGHEFYLGATVEIIEYNPHQSMCWLCTDGGQEWWLSEEEGYII